MKTKRTLLIFLCACMFAQAASAQKGFQATFDVGYGFPAGLQTVVDDNGNTRTVIPYSSGAGINADLSGTYFFTDHIGIGLDLNYLLGTPVVYHDFIDNGIRGTIIVNNTLTSNMFAVTPDLVVSMNNPGINPYARIGVVLGTASVVQTSTEDGTDAHTGTYIETTTGSLAAGFYGGTGVQIALSDNFALDVELFGRIMSFEPTQSVNTQAYDGDQKSETITYAKKIDNTTAANTELTPELPFSSIGIKVGITLKFGPK